MDNKILPEGANTVQMPSECENALIGRFFIAVTPGLPKLRGCPIRGMWAGFSDGTVSARLFPYAAVSSLKWGGCGRLRRQSVRGWSGGLSLRPVHWCSFFYSPVRFNLAPFYGSVVCLLISSSRFFYIATSFPAGRICQSLFSIRGWWYRRQSRHNWDDFFHSFIFKLLS